MLDTIRFNANETVESQLIREEEKLNAGQTTPQFHLTTVHH